LRADGRGREQRANEKKRDGKVTGETYRKLPGTSGGSHRFS
jgi:hypothetical protein